MALEAPAVRPLWRTGGAWLRRGEDIIARSVEALNTLNVFPVSDADTGSNVLLTLRGIATAVPDLDDRHVSLDAVLQAAVLSAHGNSGAILAEMVCSVCRTLEEDGSSRLPPGVLLARVLRRVATAASHAVSRPVVGTILTVADETADAAEEAAEGHPQDALAVAQAAQGRAVAALHRTQEQLAVLTRAQVVDAGAQAFVLLLDVLVEVLGGPPARPLAGVEPPLVSGPAEPEVGSSAEFEVMYALRGAPRSALDALRAVLSELGHSVVIVGDQSIAQVHVHLADPGAAVEAGLRAGQPSQIRITALARGRATGERSVLSMVVGEGLAEAAAALGAIPVLRAPGELPVEVLTAALEQTTGDVVVLPNDMENLEVARHLATRLRAAGRRIAVIPTVAQVQGLAAIAVHEPSTDFDSAVVSMSNAAGHTRHGAVTIAESAAMTMAGRCQRGDVLGLVEGDFVEIGTEPAEVAWRVAQRLLSAGGELLTLVTGAGADPELAAEVRRRTLRAHDGVDVETLPGGQPRYLLLMGVE